MCVGYIFRIVPRWIKDVSPEETKREENEPQTKACEDLDAEHRGNTVGAPPRS